LRKVAQATPVTRPVKTPLAVALRENNPKTTPGKSWMDAAVDSME
jgi:hypothetical protein